MSVAVFVAVTSAVSALLWLLGAAAPGELVVAALPVSALMFVAPGIGAAVAVRVRRRSGPPDGAWPAAARRALRWAALLPAVVLAAAALDAWVGPTTPDPVPSATALVVVSLGLLVSGLVEESGWTWFLRRALGERWAATLPTVLVGLLWAGLHVIPWTQAGRSPGWVLGQAAFSVALRLLIADVVAPAPERAADARTGLLLATVLHATYNIAWVALPVLGLGYSPWLTAALTLVVVLARQVRRAARRQDAGLAARWSATSPPVRLR